VHQGDRLDNMSRKEMEEAPAKRRKLSHSSAEGAQNGRKSITNGAAETNGVLDKRSDGSAQSTLPAARQPKSGHPSAADHVQSILAEVTPRVGSRYRGCIEAAEAIASAVREVSSAGPYAVEEAAEHMQRMGSTAIPFPSPKPGKDSKLKFEYVTPSKVTLHSEVTQSLGMQADNAFTIIAQMPNGLLQDKDYLNLRAFQKRAFFLACITAGLRAEMVGDFDFHYNYQHGLKLLPVLQLTPRDKSRHKVSYFRVDVSLPTNVWSLGKTVPSMNCVRTIEGPTPFYNSCLRYTASRLDLDQLVDGASKQAPAFADSCRLGQHWLQKRGFGSSLAGGGFGWEEWTVICALLLQTGGPRGLPLFSARYSALQLFKAMLQTLSSRDMLDPWILRGPTIGIESSSAPVLYDAENGLNILYKMTAASYQALRASAQSSLAGLSSKTSSSFVDIFSDEITQPLLQYDELYSVTGFAVASEGAAAQMAPCHRLVEVLQRGLGDRVRSLDVRPHLDPAWTISAQPSSKKRPVTISIVLDPKNADRLVDHGPAAEEQDAAQTFRQFWGDKAELRRFKDGSITESLVWNASEPVTKQILCQLLKVHFSLGSEYLQQLTVDITDALPSSSVDAAAHFALVDQTFQKLSATLLGLSGLPLPIRSVAPASGDMHSSSLSASVSKPAHDPVDILIEFDSSGRWPDSLPAIQHTKIAFLVKLGYVLTASDTSLSTQVGLENVEHDVSGHYNTSFLDVTCESTPKGMPSVTLRIRIVHERELHLLQGLMSDRGTPAPTRDSLAMAVASYKRHFVAASRHSTALRVLMTQHPALSATIRLLKSWISSHLLSQHVPAECVEIIASSVFLKPSPWAAPAQATTAFLRCLSLLAKWDWITTPMIVDLSPGGDMTDAARTELSTRFQAWRKLDPTMNQVSWFVGSSVDETGTVWTSKSRMEKVIAARVQSLAAACLEVVRASTEQWSMGTATSLFVPPLQDYDFLITLRKQALPSRHGVASNGKFRNLSVDMESSSEDSGFGPVQSFLDELNGALGGTALFLYGNSRQGGKVIAGLWRPNTQGAKEWRVRLGWSSQPHTADDESGNEACTLNKEGVLKEIEILGKDLVKDVKYLR
jgi:U3 small nucleolar RNA-associated protein 22